MYATTQTKHKGTDAGFHHRTAGGAHCTDLAHEVGDHAVEAGVLEVEVATLLAGAEAAEVLGRLRDNVRAEGHLDAAQGLPHVTQQKGQEWLACDAV